MCVLSEAQDCAQGQHQSIHLPCTESLCPAPGSCGRLVNKDEAAGESSLGQRMGIPWLD